MIDWLRALCRANLFQLLSRVFQPSKSQAMTEATSYRLATGDDETDILAVLEEVAPEIPVRLDGEERQNKIKTEIRQCHQTKKSWVAVDTDGNVVGFVLARPDVHEGGAAIYLPYVGVSVASRRSGIFSTLVEKLKANGAHLIANVLHGNQSGMENILVKNGFTEIERNAKQKKFVWSPPVPAGGDAAS